MIGGMAKLGADAHQEATLKASITAGIVSTKPGHHCHKAIGMKMKFELVSKHCKHRDCVYRRVLSDGTHCCMYAAIEHQARGCRISGCDKYKRGTKIRPRMKVTTEIEWEYDYGYVDAIFRQTDKQDDL